MPRIAGSRGFLRGQWRGRITLPSLIRTEKSLAPYRECRGGNLAQNTEQGSGRGTFDRGDLKEVADSTRYGATSIPFAMKELQEG